MNRTEILKLKKGSYLKSHEKIGRCRNTVSKDWVNRIGRSYPVEYYQIVKKCRYSFHCYRLNTDWHKYNGLFTVITFTDLINSQAEEVTYEEVTMFYLK